MKNSKVKKLDYVSLTLILCTIFILFSREGSFTIQSIIIPIILSLVTVLGKNKNVIKLQKSSKFLILLLIWYVISLTINMFIHGIENYAIIQMVYQAIIIIWYIFMTQDDLTKNGLKTFVEFFIIFMTICSVYILFQNIINHKLTFSITNLIGTKMEKNYFGTFLSFALTLSAYMFFYGKNKIKYMIEAIIIFGAIIFSNSRGAILSAGVSILTLLIIVFKNNFNLKKMLLLIFGIIAALFLIKPLINMVPDWMINRYFHKSYNDYSNNDRVYRWKNAIDGFLDQPITGFGPGVFSSIPKYKITEYNVEINKSTVSHNTFLDVLVDGGIVGITLFLIFYCGVVIRLIKYDKRYIPLVFNMIINCGILGMGKSVYLWIILIIITMINEKNNILE